ncbi:exocyst complex component 6-like isoform X6 [Tachypleus tridentatus]|uniref:exocyst complex component 6-like isoform X6 n=1 Tax=Tachypleus tridentatus TaxID=6853 RepID=UPI003FD358B4
MEEDVKHVSMGALQQFNLDLIQCELFANSEPVRGFEEGALQMCFADLRQMDYGNNTRRRGVLCVLQP